jgi:hypothetical protein
MKVISFQIELFMEACRLSQGFGSNARGKKWVALFLEIQFHVASDKLYFTTFVKIML